MQNSSISQRFYLIIACILCTATYSDVQSQCNQGTSPTRMCQDAPDFCCVGLCYSTMNVPPNGEPAAWCGPNTAVHNPQYWRFMATQDSIRIDIHIDICAGGGCGLQAAIIDTCTGTVPPWDVSDVVACDAGTGFGGTMVLEYTQAEPGKVYWLMIDGCSGQICDFTFTEAYGVGAPNVTEIDTIICGDVIVFDGEGYGPGLHQIVYENPDDVDSIVFLSVTSQLTVDLADIEFCFNEPEIVALSPEVTSLYGVSSYLWSDGATDSEIFVISPEVGYGDTISVTVTDSSGCSVTAFATVLGVFDVQISPSPLPLCPEMSPAGEVEVLASGGAPPFTIMWSDTPPDTASATGIYPVTVTDADGCQIVTEVEVVQSMTPAPELAAPDFACEEDFADGVVVTVVNAIYTQYLWFDGSTGSSVIIHEPGEVIVTVTDEYGCGFVRSIQVMSYPAPQFELGADLLVCEDDLEAGIEIDIVTGPDIVDTAYIGDWVNPPLVDMPGIYGVVVTDMNGCQATDSFAVGVLDPPTAGFTFVVSGTTVYFQDNSTGGETFEWDFGDGQTDIAENPEHTYENVEEYTVQLIVSNTCGSDTFLTTVTTSDVVVPPNDLCGLAQDLGTFTTLTNDCGSLNNVYTCTAGTNVLATPDSVLESCISPEDAVVWYTFSTDFIGRVLNIEITATGFEYPFVQLFRSLDTSGCMSLSAPLVLSKGDEICAQGAGGTLRLLGTSVEPESKYYLAVGAHDSEGGLFDLCMNILDMASSPCVTDAEIRMLSRSMGADPDGPLFPGEEVQVCMQVNNFQVSTGAANCQWFQGLVPVFGNGWDSGSFDVAGMPVNATMNDQIFPAPNVENGGAWNWYTNIRYHHPVCFYNVYDVDGNGTTDMCHGFYDSDCVGPGVAGGCCGPCWESTSSSDPGAGTPLPPGWFTAGVDGTCGGILGWPAVDWGDGNTCNGPTGPWEFCFTLKVNERLDTVANPSLSLGFFTFADGETGSWTGGPSTCANDMPVYKFVPFCLETGDKPEAEFDFDVSEGTVTFTNTSLGGTGHAWDFGDGSVSNDSDPVYTYSESGTYTVTLITQGDCNTDTTSQEVTVVISGIFETGEVQALSVYPNPNNGTFTFQAEGLKGAFELQAYDILGRQFMRRTLIQNAAEQHEIVLEGMPEGVYTLSVRQGGVRFIGKVAVVSR